MSSLHSFGAFLMMMVMMLMMRGSASTRYLLDNGVEIVNSIDLGWTNEVYAMEPDKRDPGFIIMSDHVKIKMVSRDGNTQRLIAGSNIGYREGVREASMFSVMASFVQLNESIIVVADLNNHCLRSIDRETLKTAPFSGRCEASGYQNGGSSTDARYVKPCGLALSGTKLFVADNNNNAIRIVDLVSMVVSTLLSDNERLIKPRYILLGSAEFMLVSLQDNGIVNVSTSGALTLLTSQQPGYKDGPLSSASFGELRVISWMDPNVLIISDLGNNRTRIMDLLEGNVSTLCRRSTGDGSENDCIFQGIFSVLAVREKIYVSGSSSVKQYDLLRTAPVSALQPGVTTTMSGGTSGPSAVLAGVISTIVAVLAIAIAIGVVIWWRKKKSNKRRRYPVVVSKNGQGDPNGSIPLPDLPDGEEYMSIGEGGPDPSNDEQSYAFNDGIGVYVVDPSSFAYAPHPCDTLGAFTRALPRAAHSIY